MVAPRRWFLEIIAAEGQCAACFGTSALGLGSSVWSTVAWELPSQPLTQSQMLHELMDVAMTFMEVQE